MTPTETEIIEIVERIEVPRVLLHPNLDLPDTDGGAFESAWQRDAMCLLIQLVRWFWYGRTDFYVGGNMFIYFTTQQEKTGGFQGPDFFLVKNVDGTRKRRFWHLIVEDGRYPDLIIELLSPSTAKNDLTVKKQVYEQTFRTPEYFCYDPATMKLHGWRLERGHYQPIVADAGAGCGAKRSTCGWGPGRESIKACSIPGYASMTPTGIWFRRPSRLPRPSWHACRSPNLISKS